MGVDLSGGWGGCPSHALVPQVYLTGEVGPPPSQVEASGEAPAAFDCAGLTARPSCNIMGYMKRDNRLTLILHVLLHMAQRPNHLMTSQEMAACAATNPVVVRRALAGLREAGIVVSEKGHGGGWRLARAPEEVTMADVQQALGMRLDSLERAGEASACLVERAVHRALDEAVEEANRVLESRLAAMTLADLVAEVVRVHGGPVLMRGMHSDAV